MKIVHDRNTEKTRHMNEKRTWRRPCPVRGRHGRNRPALVAWTAALAVVALTCGRAGAAADGDPAASSHFERGARSYELGQYDEAIASFERAYALDPAPILLFNIAQAHRRRGDAGLALRYYRRYLDAAPAGAPDRRDAERRVRELEQELARSAAGSGARADAPVGPSEPTKSGTSPAAASGSPAANVPGVNTGPPAPSLADVDTDSGVRRWRIGVEGGVSLPQFRDAGDLATTPAFGGRALGGYRLGTEPTLLELGCALSVLPISYVGVVTGERSTSTLLGAGARLEVSHLVSTRFAVVGEALAGVTWWVGLGEGNPFTPGGAAASGPIPLLSARAALGVRYNLLPAPVFLYLLPALAFHKPLDEELGRGVSAVVSVDLPAGIGYVF